MKTKLLSFFLVLFIFNLEAQTHTIEIHPNNRVASLLMTSEEYNNWITNDGYANAATREALFVDIYQKFEDEFDFIFLILNEDSVPSNLYSGRLYQVSNNTSGIGLNNFDNTANYGSAGKLKSVIQLTRRNYLRLGPSLHELMHNWGNFGLDNEGTFNGSNFFNFKPHWGFTGGSTKGQLGGFNQSSLVDNGSNSYSVAPFGSFANRGNSVPYNQLELYLMGMIPVTDVDDFDLFTGISNYNTSANPYTFSASQKTTYTPAVLENVLGARNPTATTSQKDFRALVMVITDSPLTNTEWATVDDDSEKFSRPSSDFSSIYNFWEATNGLGTLRTDGLNNNVLGTNRFETKNNVNIYPNPVDDFIHFSGLKNPENYTIYDLIGREIQKGRINNNDKIDVLNLKSGIYFILTETGKDFKFIKK